MDKIENANKKRENENFGKQKKNFLMSQGSFNPQSRFLCQKVSPRTDTQTRQTHMEVNTEDTFQGFRIIFFQPVIKDRSKIYMSLAFGLFLQFLAKIKTIWSVAKKATGNMFTNNSHTELLSNLIMLRS